jgi:hypothetical protein
MKALIKQLFLPEGQKLRRLQGGLSKGMLMELNLANRLQYYLGLYERELLMPLTRLLSSSRSCVDVGANDGYYTLAFLRSTAERVVACEPGPIDSLLTNARANGFYPDDRFIVERQPIGVGEGQLPVAQLIQKLPLPVLLKVDIEGGEIDCLRSAESISLLSKLNWVIETHSKELEEECIDWLVSHGYETRIIDNAFWRVFVPEYRQIPHNRWLIAVPKAK